MAESETTKEPGDIYNELSPPILEPRTTSHSEECDPFITGLCTCRPKLITARLPPVRFNECLSDEYKNGFLDGQEAQRLYDENTINFQPYPKGWKLVPICIPDAVSAVLKDFNAHPENYPLYNQLWYAMLAACPEKTR